MTTIETIPTVIGGEPKTITSIEKGTKIITFATLKGGAGKTMNLFNLAGVVAASGKNVLLIDVDPQCNLTSNCGLDAIVHDFSTVRDIFENYRSESKGKRPNAEDVIFKHPIEALPTLDIIPSSIALFYIEEELYKSEDKYMILSMFLDDNKEYLKHYDYVFIDTNPSMSVFNINALYVADDIIIVTDVSSNSIYGAELFCGLWDAKRENIHELYGKEKEDNIEGLLIGNYDRRHNIAKDLLEYVHAAEFSKDIVFDTIIPATVQLKDTELSHKPINLIHKNDAAYQAFMSLKYELTAKGIL